MTQNKEYRFYGAETADISPADAQFANIKDPRALYDLMKTVWCRETCAPRMRDRWSPEDPTLGQCSVTAFLVQDIFGGEVYGVPLGDGNFHCFNKAGDRIFDLTSEQFGDDVPDYENRTLQTRETHFAKDEKRRRYELLKTRLSEKMKKPV